MTGESIPADLSGQGAPDVVEGPGALPETQLGTATPQNLGPAGEIQEAIRNTSVAASTAARVAEGLAKEDAEDGLAPRLDALVGTAGFLAGLLGDSVERHLPQALAGDRQAMAALRQLSAADGMTVTMPEADRAKLDGPALDSLGAAIESALRAQREGSTGYATDVRELLGDIQRVKDTLETAQFAVSGLRNRLTAVVASTRDISGLLDDATNDAKIAFGEFSRATGNKARATTGS